jgi:hypothetical protein
MRHGVVFGSRSAGQAYDWSIGSLPGWLRWLGMIVGWGLALAGTSFVGARFIAPWILAIPAVSMEYASAHQGNSVANTFVHQLLFYSTFGVALLPIWTILTGFQLLKNKRLAAIA